MKLNGCRSSWVLGALSLALFLGEVEQLAAGSYYMVFTRGALSPAPDLAAFYLERGRPREVKPLAEQMLPIFQAQDVHRELIAA